jgi:high-affinity iron transporter
VKVRIGAGAVVVAVALGAAGCGSSGSGDAKKEAAEQSATPQQAVAEIAKVRTGLAAALATYKGGDRAAADEQVGTVYLEHFELVEPPLRKVDGELEESLEDGIRETLRARMKAGAPDAQVALLVRQIDAKLDRAKTALG